MKKEKKNDNLKKIKVLISSAEVLSNLGHTKTVDAIVDKIDELLIKL